MSRVQEGGATSLPGEDQVSDRAVAALYWSGFALAVVGIVVWVLE